jgi:hypothetical protein
MNATVLKALILGGAAWVFSGCIWRKNPEPPVIQKTPISSPAPPAPVPPPVPEKPVPPLPPVPEKPTAVTIPVARPIPGKEGVVFSPFNNKPIDVKGYASGTLVADPTFPLEEKKYFRVP